MPTLDLDPGEITVLLRGLPPRQELIYRLAVRRLSVRCRSDRQFRERTDELTAKFNAELPAITIEAAKLADELSAAARAR
jgi:hypothetical protein